MRACFVTTRTPGSRSPIKGRAALRVVATLAVVGCIPTARLPSLPVPANSPGLLPADDVDARRAIALAPVLYLQRDEPFALLRVVAVVHPTQPVVAYHLLWTHDVHGQWMPWAHATDHEEVWVRYDSTTGAATDVWTYWHGSILHAPWSHPGPIPVNVQWGKHGSDRKSVV